MESKNKKTKVLKLILIFLLFAVIIYMIPIIIEYINTVNKNKFKDNVLNIVSIGEQYYEKQKLIRNKEKLVFEFPNNIGDLKIEGQMPESGEMIITEDGQIAIAASNGKYCVIKGFENSNITILENVEICEIEQTLSLLAVSSLELEVQTVDSCIKNGSKCVYGTPFAIKVNDTTIEKFYVIEDTGTEVTLIMNRNIGDKVAWINQKNYTNKNSSCTSNACNDEGPLDALNLLNELTNDEWTNIPMKEYVYNDDSNQKKYTDVSIKMRARMITETEVNKLKKANNNQIPEYLYTNLSSENTLEQPWGYWFSTATSNYPDCARFMMFFGGIENSYVTSNTFTGIRPVITLSR